MGGIQGNHGDGQIPCEPLRQFDQSHPNASLSRCESTELTRVSTLRPPLSSDALSRNKVGVADAPNASVASASEINACPMPIDSRIGST